MAILDETLARQGSILEALFHRLIADAMAARIPAVKTGLMKSAMQAQRSLVAVIERMERMQTKIGPARGCRWGLIEFLSEAKQNRHPASHRR